MLVSSYPKIKVMIVFNDEFLSINFFSEQNYILVVRKANVDIDFKDYKATLDKWLEIILKYKPNKQLIDYSDLTVPLKAEFQQYAYKNLVIPSAECCIKKIAFILSRNLFAQMSVEKIMSKASDIAEYKYFNDFNKAKNWLLE